ncbi:hypothetical protein [Streptomyces sp. enrichment culture]|uniref:tetratricopeptide repeat protein n=1 Tax=Streptomyces sp. enrichment culture TaxID=1795815 RepID=UPI003F579EAE
MIREELRLLWERAGRPPLSSLVEHSRRLGHDVSRSSLGEAKNPNTTGGMRWPTVEAFLDACESYARARRHPLPHEVDKQYWQALLERSHPSTRSKSASQPAALPASCWSPSDLDVHDALTADGDPGVPLPPLPPYLRREFDAELDRALVGAGEGSLLVALTGKSSTGKTRAMYEAVRTHPELSARPLFYPRTAESFLELAASHRRTPGVVLWMNEAQNLLCGEAGEKVAETLRTWFDDSQPGSVVGLASMWPEYWDQLVAEPAPGSPDPHAQARQLLTHRARRIRVPDMLTAEHLTALTEQADADPRLLQAAAAAGPSRRVIQTLTGGPYLVDRYEHPQTDEALLNAALLSAAIDLRRLGVPGAVPAPLLTAAARDYLDIDLLDGLLPENWTQVALDDATRRQHGIRALTPRREPPPDGDTVVYQVHDYLEQHGRARRRDKVPPDSFWQAAERLRTVEELRAPAEAAEARGRLRPAARLLSRAAMRGDRRSAVHLARLLDSAGRAREAHGWWRFAADAGDSRAMVVTGTHLQRQGDVLAALRWWTTAADAGDLEAPCLVAYHLDAVGRTAEARDWWRRAAQANGEYYYANRTIMDFLIEQGRSDEAAAWAPRRCSYAGGHHQWDALARLLHRQGRTDEAITWWKELLAEKDLDHGDYALILREAAETMIAAGEPDMTVSWLRELADRGNWHARAEAVERMRELGRIDEAVQWLKAHAVSRASTANDDTVDRVADLLVSEGRTAEAWEWLRQRASAGDLSALARAIGQLQAQGETERALRWLTDDGACSLGKAPALRALCGMAGLLRAAGHRSLALILVQEAAEPYGHGGGLFSRLIEEDSRSRHDLTPAQARTAWEEAYSSLDAVAMRRAVALLEAVGAYEDVRARLATAGAAGEPGASGSEDMQEVSAWMRRRIDEADPRKVAVAAGIAVRSGLVDEAQAAYAHVNGAGYSLMSPGTMGALPGPLVSLLEERGRIDEALDQLLSAGGEFHYASRNTAAEILTRAGRLDEAIALLLRHDDHTAIARLYVLADRPEEALAALRRAADQGRTHALTETVRLLEQLGRSDTACRLREYGWNPDGTVAQPWTAPQPPPGAAVDAGRRTH